MALGTKSFDPKSVSLTVGGIPITGFAPGSFINITADADLWNTIVGADGEVCRVKTNSGLATATITLMASSDSNDTLSAIYSADFLSNSGIAPVLCKDGNGRSTHFAAEAWVQKIADKDYSTDTPTVAWTIKLAKLEAYIGGMGNA